MPNFSVEFNWTGKKLCLKDDNGNVVQKLDLTEELEMNLVIVLKVHAGMVYKADIRNELNMSVNSFCKQIRLIERINPAFEMRYAFFKHKNTVPLSVAKTIIHHIYPDAVVVV